MRITENNLRSIIRSIISENVDGHLSPLASGVGIDIYCQGSDKTHFLLYIDTQGVTGKYAESKHDLIEKAIEKQLGKVVSLDNFNYLCKFPSEVDSSVSQTPQLVAENILYLCSRY